MISILDNDEQRTIDYLKHELELRERYILTLQETTNSSMQARLRNLIEIDLFGQT